MVESAQPAASLTANRERAEWGSAAGARRPVLARLTEPGWRRPAPAAGSATGGPPQLPARRSARGVRRPAARPGAGGQPGNRKPEAAHRVPSAELKRGAGRRQPVAETKAGPISILHGPEPATGSTPNVAPDAH